MAKEYTAALGTPSSPLDMHGNVWEWCLGGERDYTQGALSDPKGPLQTGADCVIRGGCWSNDAWRCYCAYRFRVRPDDGGPELGFRCARVQG